MRQIAAVGSAALAAATVLTGCGDVLRTCSTPDTCHVRFWKPGARIEVGEQTATATDPGGRKRTQTTRPGILLGLDRVEGPHAHLTVAGRPASCREGETILLPDLDITCLGVAATDVRLQVHLHR